MRYPKFISQFIILAFPLIFAACSSPIDSPVRPEDVEATVVAKVEATLVADAVNVEQRIQATLTAVAAETQTAIALLPANTPTATPTSTPTPTSTETPTVETLSTDTPEPTPTSTSPIVGYRVSGPANLRSGPGTDYEIVGALQAGDTLSVLARTEDSTWFQIKTEADIEAWLAAFLLESQPDAANIPVAVTIPERPTPVPTVLVSVPTVEQEAPIEQQAPIVNSEQRLDVAFINPHYNYDRGDDGARIRYFQTDFFITNTLNEIIEAKWAPTRWIISAGEESRVDIRMFEWTSRRGNFYNQPDIPPGGSEGWTYVAPRVELYEWVQAVEWEYKGQLYRQEFENNAINRAEWNYKSCQ